MKPGFEDNQLPVKESSEPLRYRSFRHLVLARGGTSGATQMFAVAAGWQIYALTHSALALGLVGLLQFLPLLFFALAGGQIADRYDRRIIARITMGTQGLAMATLAVGSSGGWITPAIIYSLIFVLGTARAFEMPAMQSLLPNLVPTRIIANAMARSSSIGQTAIMTGPAIGGFLYGLHPSVVYGTSCVIYLAGSIVVGTVRLERPPQKREPVTLKSVFAGLQYIRDQPLIRGAITLDLFVVLLGGATALLPIYAHDILKTGPAGLGLLQAAPAVGAVSMSLLLARYPFTRHMGKILFGAVAGFGIATVVFALSHSIGVSLAALALTGAADQISVVIRVSLIQVRTPDAMRGRVNAVNFLFADSANQLGGFESGLTASWFGAVPAVLIGGTASILVAIFFMKFFPALARTQTLQSEPVAT